LKDETTDYAPTKDLLRGYYPDVKDEIFDWILDRSLRSLKGVGNKQRNYLEELKAEKTAQEADLSDVRGRIVRELEELNKKYKFPRKTQISTEDITFDIVKKRKPDPVPVVVICNGMFIRKLKGVPSNAALEGAVKCMSDDSISYLDSKGRLLRVQLEEIDFNTPSEKGTYLPRYSIVASNSLVNKDFRNVGECHMFAGLPAIPKIRCRRIYNKEIERELDLKYNYDRTHL
jgi:DNA gyrase/topoisomerase IV subunit A